MIEADFPGVFHDADKIAVRGQRQTFLLSKLRLVSAVAAALGGALSWKVGRFDIWALVALLGFLAALFAEIMLWTQRPERDWTAGRTIAEDIKSLAWRFTVCGHPFPATMPLPQARKLFQQRVNEIVARDGVGLTFHHVSRQTTPPMAELRGKELEERRQTYLDERITNQQEYYSASAGLHQQRASKFRTLLVAGELLAIVLAAGKGFGVWDVDISGVMAAIVASGAAWLGLRQYEKLRLTYSMAANSLANVGDQLADVAEEEWAASVMDAEDSFRKENTTWMAGQPSAT
ncbi:hypothetical protein UK23_28860 [Lentzea aerocolonigenes]|uniref:SMODS and SLOG-associating 2TM effector domain-containing protein n=1 Tax=Lentzea aerocolonigenes TaxID=68170 RepID=A0A0F0GRN1_LENAE|nr:DUF4231 domain-containing protein [Lentzea aerocolonigenes]KJK44622.1 hypothetical protein UK23_28860 [Lentzea aerocolonigenes]